MRKNLVLTLTFVLLAFSAQAQEAASPAHALAMHGAPKYGEGFAQFDYVKPDAPKGGTLHLGVVGSFDSLNPFIVRGTVPQAPAFSLFSSAAVYESLMARSWDEPFSLYGLIAQSVEVPEDRASITFILNPKAHWQDGKPITADDVLFSFRTLRDKGRPNHRTFYKKVEKAEKLGPLRVRFVFKKNPDGTLDREMPLIMGLMPVIPAHVWQGKDFNQTSLTPPVASGPYKVTSVDPGRSITLTRDPAYWGKDIPVQKGMYNFDEVKIDYYRDDSVAAQAFLAGAYDVRRESDPKKWAKLASEPAVKEGRVAAVRFPESRTEAVSGFIMNTRRPLFKDVALREALDLAFDFDWINKALLYGMGRRTESYFPNSELAAGRAAPEGAEKDVLLRFEEKLSAAIFEAVPELPQGRRARLLAASRLLEQAGYALRNGRLLSSQGEAISFEVMLSDPSEEKIALEWARNLERLGIEARVRTVDSAQFQARLTGFDYDVTVGRWFNSLSPGNEQMNYWSCAAAQTQGSRNYAGICDPVVDALAASIPAARTRAALVGATRALDRVLMAGHYIVPFYYLGVDPIAYQTSRVAHPDATPVYGPILESWWAKK